MQQHKWEHNDPFKRRFTAIRAWLKLSNYRVTQLLNLFSEAKQQQRACGEQQGQKSSTTLTKSREQQLHSSNTNVIN